MKAGLFFLAGVLCTLAVVKLWPSSQEKIQADFAGLVSKEAKAYAEATDADAKLQAADELYSKMMVLFLAHLGLNLNKNETVLASCPETDRPAVVVTESEPVAPAQCPSCPICPSPVITAPTKKPETLHTAEAKFKAADYPRRLDERLRRLLGRFEGVLIHKMGPHQGRADRVEMTFDFQEQQGKFSGKYSVILTDPDGKTYSNNRGDGGNRVARFGKNDENFYIEASPYSYFSFTLKGLRAGRLRGMYMDEGKFVGEAQLMKVE